MMRDILFRGKQVDTNEWVEGGFYLEPYTENAYIVAWNSHGLGFIDYILVCRDTVGQYTCMTDKNGKRIFEGDIVKSRIDSGAHAGFEWPNKEVSFREGAFCFLDTKGGIFCALGAFAPSVSHEVIGNIHDNPELLKEDT